MKPGTRKLINDMRDMRVLVVHPQDAEGQALINQLRRFGCQVRDIWPPAMDAIGDVDAIFQLVDASEDSKPPPPVQVGGPTFLAIVDYENPSVLKRLLDHNAHGVITKPIRPFGILSALVLARSLNGYTRRLETKVQKLEDTLKGRRDVEKAVKYLMTLRNIREAEAYEMLRRQATQKRISMARVAATILGARDVLDGMGLLGGD
ncbi:MAG: ANTAR domain-containing protein [Rhodobacteraceae bacterium]|nr:MAG: ANTAR domain-containing protein [Paracoccaceae bacterium]